MTYKNDWQSLNSRPVPEWFNKAKFGIFIHWGIYSVPAYSARGEFSEWYMRQLEDPQHPSRIFHDKTYGPNFKYEDFVTDFKAELFNAKEWAELFKKAGAKYINFVSKHHDGFCMFPSAYSWNWNSVDVGPHRDFCMELKQAMDEVGVKFGVYHSVYEWFNPLYLKDPEEYAVKHLHPMLKELICRYEPWTLFTDGEWEHTSDVWHSTEFLTWLYNESPVKDKIVPNDRWGKETRGRMGGNFTSEYGYVNPGETIDDIVIDRPFEECRGIGGSFGFNRIEKTEDYLTPKQLIEMLCDIVSQGGNFLLNIGPASDGTIPTIMEERLLQIGQWLDVNGEAIYDTDVYTKNKQNGVYYTRKDDKIFAIINKFPYGSITLERIPFSTDITARLLSCDAPITINNDSGKAQLVFPAINPDDVKCQWLYAIELSNI